MNLRLTSLIVAALLSTFAVACASSEEPASNTDDAVSEDELRAKKITEADDGKTVTIEEGQTFNISLPSNPTTGFDWKVLSTTRTLGYPYQTRFFAGGEAVGSGGETRMYWKTASPFSMVGKHDLELGYLRSFESKPPEKTIRITIEITPKGAAAAEVVKVPSASGQTVAVTEGQDIVLELAGPQPSPLTGWRVTSTTRTLGYPEQEWIQGDGAIGSSGTTKFTWRTKGPLSKVGQHQVRLQIDRGHGDGVSTFEFTADIKPKAN